ncbi:hypothetical protein RCZ04_09540 [Capnocytophaga sp. HP1101]
MTDYIYLLAFVPLIVFLLVFMYLTMVRKNEFEERLALFRPTHQLSQKREAYLKGLHKFRYWVIGIIIVVFVAPLPIVFLLMWQEGLPVLQLLSFDEVNSEVLILCLIGCLGYWLINYVFKRNEKALRMLVEQMSDSDFEHLLKVKSKLFVITCYSPPFVLCNKQLYFFLFYAIREIDPAKITDIDWGYTKNGFYVKIKSPKTTRITMSRGVLPYLLQIVNKYNKKIHVTF